MRPIDADELIKKNLEDMKNHADFMTVVILSTFNEILVNEPQIRIPDAKPVRHGEWKKIQNFARCSECMHEVNWGNKDFLSPYCPNCGAKMDGGDSS